MRAGGIMNEGEWDLQKLETAAGEAGKERCGFGLCKKILRTALSAQLAACLQNGAASTALPEVLEPHVPQLQLGPHSGNSRRKQNHYGALSRDKGLSINRQGRQNIYICCGPSLFRRIVSFFLTF